MSNCTRLRGDVEDVVGAAVGDVVVEPEVTVVDQSGDAVVVGHALAGISPSAMNSVVAISGAQSARHRSMPHIACVLASH